MVENKEEVKAEVDRKVSLKEFVDDYQKTLSIVGVFMAVGLLWKNLNPDSSVPYVAYLWFVATIPLMLEVMRGFAAHTASLSLTIFYNLFQIVFVTSVIEIFTRYFNHTAKFIWPFGWIALGVCGMFFLQQRQQSLASSLRKKYLDDFESARASETIVDDRNKRLNKLNAEYLVDHNRISNRFATYSLLVLVFSLCMTIAVPNLTEAMYIGDSFSDHAVPEVSISPLPIPSELK